jgi:inner membrane protein
VSVVLLATLRRSLQQKLVRAPASAAVDSLVGEQVVLLADLAEGGEGQAELRGVPWTARLASGGALRKGQRGRVERVEGLTLWVRAE